MDYDVTVTIGSRPLVKAILGLIEPALANVAGVYPLAVPGATDSGLRIDDLVTDVVGVPGSGLALSISANGHLFGNVPAAVGKNVGLNELTTLTTLQNVTLPFGQLMMLPLGTGDATQHTHDIPLSFAITVPLTLRAPAMATDHELVFVPGAPTVTTPATPDVADVAAFLTAARDRVTALVQAVLGPGAIVTLPDATVAGPLATLLAELTASATQRIGNTLSSLPAISLGRMTAPTAGVSCVTALVPTAAAVNVDVTSTHDFFLQIGLMLGGRPAAGATFAPTMTSPAPTTLDVSISPAALLLLLCCMVESLPNLVLPDMHSTNTDDLTDRCCEWFGAVVNLGPAAFTGVHFALCVQGPDGGPKSITLKGDFSESIAVPHGVPVLGGAELLAVAGRFSTTIEVDLDHLGRLTALKTPEVSASVSLSQGGALAGLLSSVPILGFPWVEGAALAVQVIVENQLNSLIQTVFAPLKTLTSVPVIPPGLLEVFGDLTSQLVRLDDLDVTGVAWAPPGLRRLEALHIHGMDEIPGGGLKTIAAATGGQAAPKRPRKR